MGPPCNFCIITMSKYSQTITEQTCFPNYCTDLTEPSSSALPQAGIFDHRSVLPAGSDPLAWRRSMRSPSAKTDRDEKRQTHEQVLGRVVDHSDWRHLCLLQPPYQLLLGLYRHDSKDVFPFMAGEQILSADAIGVFSIILGIPHSNMASFH